MIYFRFQVYKLKLKIKQFLVDKFGNLKILYLPLTTNDKLFGFINYWQWIVNNEEGITFRIGHLRLIYSKKQSVK